MSLPVSSSVSGAGAAAAVTSSGFSASSALAFLSSCVEDIQSSRDISIVLSKLDSIQQLLCNTDNSPEHTAVMLALVLSGDGLPAGCLSLPALLRMWVKDEQLDKARVTALSLLVTLCQHQTTSGLLTPIQLQSLLSLSFYVVRAEKLGRVKEKAFDLIHACYESPIDWKASTLTDSLTPRDMIQLLWVEINRNKTAVTQTVRGQLLSTLGLLAEHFPEALAAGASSSAAASATMGTVPITPTRLAELYVRSLQDELSPGKEPHRNVIVGCFVGLISFLNKFSTEFTKPSRSRVCDLSVLYRCLKTGLSMQEGRFEACRMALNLFVAHSALWRPFFTPMKETEAILSLLLAAAKHHNSGVSKRALNAMNAFIANVAEELVTGGSPGDEKKRVFQLLLHLFVVKLEEKRSVADISVAIRAIGCLAKAIAVFLPQSELNNLLHQLFLISEQLYITSSSEELEKATAQFDAFIESFALIINCLQTLDPSVVSHILRLLSRFFHVYPTLTTSQRPHYATALITLLVVIQQKHATHFQALLDSLVHEGLLLTISKLPELTQSFQTAIQSEGAAPPVVERFAYVEYCYLWHHLFGVWIAQDPRYMKSWPMGKHHDHWNLSLNYHRSAVVNMRKALYNALIKEIIAVHKQLDLTLQEQNKTLTSGDGGHRATGPSSSLSSASLAAISGSDLSASLQPSVPKDYALYLNMVEFIHRFFLPDLSALSPPNSAAKYPPASFAAFMDTLAPTLPFHVRRCLLSLSRWFVHWLYPFSSGMIQLSNRYPLVSGFYKLMTLTISIAEYYHYFDPLNSSFHQLSKAELKQLTGEESSVAAKQEQVNMKQEMIQDDENDVDGDDADAVALLSDSVIAAHQRNTAANQHYVRELLHHYVYQVLHRMSQFTAELLYACIRLVLSVPSSLCNPQLLLSPLQRALQLGLTYHPAAQLAIETMEKWNQHRETNELFKSLLPHILPLLDDYLRLPQQQREQEVGASTNNQDTPTSVVATTVDTALVYRLLEFLGSLGGAATLLLGDRNVTPALPQEVSTDGNATEANADAQLVAWSTQSFIRYPLPFHRKLDVVLDSLLPRLCHLAEFSSERKIKIAAGEALHAIIIYMIATAARDPNRVADAVSMVTDASSSPLSSVPPTTTYEPLYRHLFPVLLRLACDSEQVIQALFSPLVKQLIHWYTNREQTYMTEMAALLDALCSAVGDAQHSALRQWCASALAEVFHWSNKHSASHHFSASSSTRPSEQADYLPNVRALMRRLFALTRHPSPYKRLGASLTFNQLYIHFREDDVWIDYYTLGILYQLFASLQLSAQDDAATATGEECQIALDHFVHMLIEPTTTKYKLLTSARSRSGSAECQSLHVFLCWLMSQLNHHEEEYRRQCMAVLLSLMPYDSSEHTMHSKTRHAHATVENKQIQAQHWIEKYCSDNGGHDCIIALIEQADNDSSTRVAAEVVDQETSRAPVEFTPKINPPPFVSAGSFTSLSGTEVSALSNWLASLSAALDVSYWLLSSVLSVDSPLSQLISTHTHLFDVLQTFISFAASDDCQLSPSVLSTYSHSALVIIRLFRFCHLLLSRFPSSASSTMLSLFNTDFFSLTWNCLLHPEKVGFNVTQQDRIQSLQSIVGAFVTTMRTSTAVDHKHQDAALKVLRGLLSPAESSVSPECLTCSWFVQHTGEASIMLEGYKQLRSSGWLLAALGQAKCSDLGQQLLQEMYDLCQAKGKPDKVSESDGKQAEAESKQDNSITNPAPAISLSPMVLHVGHQLLKFSLLLDVDDDLLMKYLSDVSSSFYLSFHSLLDSYLCTHFSSFCHPLLTAALNKYEMFSILINVADYAYQRRQRKMHGRSLVESLNITPASPGAAVSDASTEAESYVDIMLQHLASAYQSVRLGVAISSPEEGDQSHRAGGSHLSGKKLSARHRQAHAQASTTETKPEFVSFTFPADTELALLVLQLFQMLFDLNAEKTLQAKQPSFQFIVAAYISCLAAIAPLSVKQAALNILPYFLPVTTAASVTAPDSTSIETQCMRQIAVLIHAPPFPIRSTDLAVDSSQWRDYTRLFDALLRAVQISKNFALIQTMLPILREKNHAYKHAILRSIKQYLLSVNEVGKPEQPKAVCEQSINIFNDTELDLLPVDNARCWLMEYVCIPLLRIAPLSVVRSFFQTHAVQLWKRVEACPNGPVSTQDVESQQLQLCELRIGYQLIEVMFRRLNQEDLTTCQVTHKEVMKIAHTHVKKVSDSGVISLTDFRVSAYAALIAALCRTQRETRFFNVLVFSENVAKNDILWDHIIDIKSRWTFILDTNFKRIEAGLAEFIVFKQSTAKSYAEGRERQGLAGWMDSLSDSQSSQSMGGEGLSRYMSSQYLSDSSQNAVGLFTAERKHRMNGQGILSPPSSQDSEGGAISNMSAGGEAAVVPDAVLSTAASTPVSLDLDVVVSQSAFPVLLDLITHMDTTFDAVNRDTAKVMPVWMENLRRKMQSIDEHQQPTPPTHVNVKWTIAKIVIVKWDIFAPWHASWWKVVADLVLLPSQVNGGVGFHYFLRDICVTFLRWSFVPDAKKEERALASCFVRHLMVVSVDHGQGTVGKRAKLRSNLQIIRLFIEQWKSALTIDKSVIINHLNSEITKQDRTGGEGVTARTVGIQLLAMIVQNGFFAYDPAVDAKQTEEAMVDALMSNIMSEKKALYEPAAEVYGLILKANTRLSADHRDHFLWYQKLRSYIKQLFSAQTYQLVLTVLVKLGIHTHALHFFDRNLCALLFQLPYFHLPDLMQKLLQCILWAANDVEQLYTQLCNTGWMDRVLQSQDHKSQELLLMILYKHLDEVPLDHLRHLLPQLSSIFSNHPHESCRALYYKILIYLQQTHRQMQELKTSAPADPLLQTIYSGLIRGLNDPAPALQASLFKFFDTATNLPLELPARLLQLLTSLHQSDSATASHWLSSAVSLLLYPMRSSSDFDRPISDVPLQECKFTVLDIDAEAYTRSIPFTPLFADSQVEIPETVLDDDEDEQTDNAEDGENQDAEMKDSTKQDLSFHPGVKDESSSSSSSPSRRRSARPGQILATQAPAFPLTQSLLNMDAEQLMQYNLSQQSQSEYLFYRPKAEGGAVPAGSLAEYQLTPQQRIRRRKMKHGRERGGVKSRSRERSTRVTVGNDTLQLRFGPGAPGSDASSLSSSSQDSSRYFSAVNDFRRRYSRAWEQRRREEAANRISLYRQYRIGELPDIQILHRELLLPLQALHQDPTIAKQLFVLVVTSLYQQIDAWTGTGQQDEPASGSDFRSSFSASVYRLLLSFTQLSPAEAASASPTINALHTALIDCARVDPSVHDTVSGTSLSQLALLSAHSNNLHSGILWLESCLARALSAEAAQKKPADNKHGSRRQRGRPPSRAGRASGAGDGEADEKTDDTADGVVDHRSSVSDHCLFQLAHLYSLLGENELTLQLYSQSSHHPLTRYALQSSLREDHNAALAAYDIALAAFDQATEAKAAGGTAAKIKEIWKNARMTNDRTDNPSRLQSSFSSSLQPADHSGLPTNSEVELWNTERLQCLHALTEWSQLRENVLIEIDQQLPRLFAAEYRQPDYLYHYLTATLKTAQDAYLQTHQQPEKQKPDSSQEAADLRNELDMFVTNALSDPSSAALLEAQYSAQLLLLYSFRGSAGLARARHYLHQCHASFLSQWSSSNALETQTRQRLLQGLQEITEVAEFLDIQSSSQHTMKAYVTEEDQWISQQQLIQRLIQRWAQRSPNQMDSLQTWDNILNNRSTFGINLCQTLTEQLHTLHTEPQHKLRQSLLSALTTTVLTSITRLITRAAFAVASNHNFHVAQKYLDKAKILYDHQCSNTQERHRDMEMQLFYARMKLTLKQLSYETQHWQQRQQQVYTKKEEAAADEDVQDIRMMTDDQQQQEKVLASHQQKLVASLQKTLQSVHRHQLNLGLDSAKEREVNKAAAYRLLNLKADLNQQLAVLHREKADTYYEDADDDLSTLSALFAPLAVSYSRADSASTHRPESPSASSSTDPNALKKATKAFLAVARYANKRLLAGEQAEDASSAGSMSFQLPSPASSSTLSKKTEQHLIDLFVVNVLYAMKLHDRSARSLFPRVLELVAKCPPYSTTTHLFRVLTSGQCIGTSRARKTHPSPCTCQSSNTTMTDDDSDPPLSVFSSSRIPCWMFLQWVPQLLSTLGLPEYSLVAPILHELAKAYPQAVYFPFHLSRSTMNEKMLGSTTGASSSSGGATTRNSSTMDSLSELSSLLSSRLLPLFTFHLDALTFPEHKFKDMWGDFSKAVQRQEYQHAINIYQSYRQKQLLHQTTRVGLGPLNVTFIRRYRPRIEELFTVASSGDVSKMKSINIKTMTDKYKKLYEEMSNDKDCGTKKRLGQQSLALFSEWCLKYSSQASTVGESIEIPGQYSGTHEPVPENHVKLVSFSRTVLIMSSIRRPKKIVLLGSDEREYPYLVKGGEDMRLDQRVEQLFVTMNEILQTDHHCATAAAGALSLLTYAVIPLTSRLGLVEWLPNTTTLKSLLNQTAEAAGVTNMWTIYQDYINRLAPDPSVLPTQQLLNIIESVPADTVRTEFAKVCESLPPDLLQRALLSLSSSNEAFLVLRSRFASSFSCLTVSGYVLGLGDRHLDNFLLDESRGNLAAIDFGAAFGQGVLLQIPELMPMRLTRQFQYLYSPLPTIPLLCTEMAHVMRAYQQQKQQLMVMMEVFVKEPQIDWIEAAKHKQHKQAANNPNQIDAAASASSLSSVFAWYPRAKLSVCSAKLHCANPCRVLMQELQDNTVVRGATRHRLYAACESIVCGTDQQSMRSKIGKYCANVEEQIQCLVEQAIDTNILGRTWTGWAPQV